MESKVCSRSHGHPPGARNRAMMPTARSKRSPVVAIATTVKQPGAAGKPREPMVVPRRGQPQLSISSWGLRTRPERLHIQVDVRSRNTDRWSVAGAAVLMAVALSCGGGGGGSYSTATTPTPTATAPQPQPQPQPPPAGSGAPSTPQICACTPSEPAISDYRHDQKHVGLS